MFARPHGARVEKLQLRYRSKRQARRGRVGDAIGQRAFRRRWCWPACRCPRMQTLPSVVERQPTSRYHASSVPLVPVVAIAATLSFGGNAELQPRLRQDGIRTPAAGDCPPVQPPMSATAVLDPHGEAVAAREFEAGIGGLGGWLVLTFGDASHLAGGAGFGYRRREVVRSVRSTHVVRRRHPRSPTTRPWQVT